MAGLLIKELLIRGDLERCLIVAPGALVEQWQEEPIDKFGLAFELLTLHQIEASITGNPFVERNRLIVRLDMAARSDELRAKIEAAPDWDLIVCDEAHRMAASYFGGEVKETQRYKLGKLLGTRTRNFLLMSATPHNGKEADFRLFMRLLDADRFEGRFRDGVHKADASDMMRRLTKEELFQFDGTKLFPERRAYTAGYALSPAETDLYQAVTSYVREEMNRAHTTAIFRQVNKDNPRTHHDALEFPDGKRVLLTDVFEGQEATVLQLPPQPATAAEIKAQERVRHVG